MKHKEKLKQHTKLQFQFTNNPKKHKPGLCDKQIPARKHQLKLNYSNQLRQTNYDSIVKI